MAQDADDAVGEASANAVRFGYFTCNVLLFDPDCERLDGTTREVVKQLQHRGFGARAEEVNHERRWAQEWIEVLLDLQGVTPTPAQRAALWRALELLAESPSRTMTDLVHTLQDQELREALAHYTLSGPLGHLLDAQTEDLGQGRLQVFEMSHLMALGQKHLVPILLYLFHRVEQRLETGTPSLVIVEEAWITALHSLFGTTLESWLRTLRKKNAAVVFVSQSVADVVNSPRRDIILVHFLSRASRRHVAMLLIVVLAVTSQAWGYAMI